MSPALMLLLRLRLLAFLRRYGRTLRTGKGLLMTLFGLLVFTPWFFSIAMASRNAANFAVEPARRYGPLVLLAYGLLTLLLSAGDRLLYYTPAEVAFLFSGPFRQRELLTYKLASIFFNTAFSSLIFTAAMIPYRRSWLAGFVGFYLAMIFFQMIWIVAGLAVGTAGALARTRLRRTILFLMLGLVVAAALSAGTEWVALGPHELFARIEASPAIRIASTPFRPFVYAFTSDGFGPALLLWGGVAAAMTAVATLTVYLLNFSYLEALANSSAKTYERVLQMRRGGSWTASRARTGPRRKRWELPDFPYWGGVGPTFRRQLLGALRDPTRLTFTLLLTAIPLVITLAGRRSPGAGRGLVFAAEGMVVWLTVFLTPVIPFDFRGDIDRKESLKTLPNPSWALCLGQILTPTILIAVPQVLALTFAAVLTGTADAVVLLALGLVFPAVFEIIAIENLSFLLYPTRLVASNPGDFTAVGRQLVVMFLKLLVIGGTFGVCGGLAALTAWLVPWSLAPALLVALAGLTVCALATVPFVAWAYDRYDVARDTPA